MSKNPALRVTAEDHDNPRFEPWLAIMILSMIPLAVAPFTPFQIALYVLGVGLFVTGLVVFIVRERRLARLRRLRSYVPARVVEGDPVDVEEVEP